MSNAEQEVLAICRSGRRKDGKSQDGLWCMRELDPRNPKRAQGKCAIIDNARWNSPVVAQGDTWEQVLERMP